MVLEVASFAMDVYILGLPSIFSDWWLFRIFPTLLALLFLAVFVGYLILAWSEGHPLHRRIGGPSETRSEQIRSNITFTIPVLIPWFVLSTASDILHLLPFPKFKAMLDTPAGEAVFFLTFLIIATLTAPQVIQRFWRCAPVEAGAVRSRIAELCRRAGVTYREIVYWPIHGGRMLTAGVMGLVGRFRYILVTDALLELLTADELDAVMAHEIGHVKKHHLLFYLFFFAGYLLISYAVYDLMLLVIIYGSPLIQALSARVDHTGVASIAFSIMAVLLFLLYFRFVFGYFMRNFERQADTYVYAMFPSGRPLIRTLEKIARTGTQSPDKPNWHHFSISQRIDYLVRCENDRRWIGRQDRKIRRSIGIYLAGLLAFALVGYHLQFGETRRQLDRRIFEKAIVRELDRHPDNADLHSLLGDFRLEQAAYADAIAAYEEALRLDPGNPRTLNNLAWVLATCEEMRFRDPPRALELAKLAVSLSPEPYILDTLAESLFVNGDYNAAIAVEQRALEKDPAGGDYYRRQIQKFEKTLRAPQQ
jgi:Zn-dependent protease with chaperone function